MFSKLKNLNKMDNKSFQSPIVGTQFNKYVEPEQMPCLNSNIQKLDTFTIAALDTVENNASPIVPLLAENEMYHVFISYSNMDSTWAHLLINKLETMCSNLKVCYHERDFIPGKNIIENMTDAIQSSQKILLVLSPDFVQSRWCLLEANLSLFKDLMERKPIIPVMLKPCPIPLHLNHLTYLDAKDCHFFEKLVKVLCTCNQLLKNSAIIPYQSSSLYNGKTLLSLYAVNENVPKWQPGTFSWMTVPDQLKMIIEDPEIYRKAICIINNFPSSKSCFGSLSCRIILCIALSLLVPGFITFYMFVSFSGNDSNHSDLTLRAIQGLPILMIGVFLMPAMCINIFRWSNRRMERNLYEMSHRTGEANLVMMHNWVLIGCESLTKLHFVYVSLEECKKTFNDIFQDGNPSSEEMFQRAIIYFSSGYTCCVAKKYFPFYDQINKPGHLENGVCFCQYVSMHLKDNIWS
ncbi:uncharacterized protein LOC115095614 [Rhinatrema bivittatum]|uniref:uncharacterized protein LOC115095614 n=1 Tax=Rhinatrema bivittatum TaxID=194408 RepID=UPI00112E0463|nr:uncharacterized protein LOC115095614 [Rhinatrema bivittatum]